MKSVTPRLKRLIAGGEAVTICRKGLTDTSSIHGVILKATSQCVLVHQIREFHLDGYLVLRLEDIERIRFNRYDEHFNRILVAEGALSSAGCARKLDLSSFEDLLEQLKQSQETCILEGCYENIDEVYLIGFLTEIDTEEDFAHFMFFDSAGVFESKERGAYISFLSSVELQTEYIECHEKHMQNDPRPNNLAH